MVMFPSVCWDCAGVTASGKKPAIAAIAPKTPMADRRVSPSRGPIVKLFECCTVYPFHCGFVCGNAVGSPSFSAFVSAALEVML
jgi:hypothetical protein